jgi:hypothetical protein
VAFVHPTSGEITDTSVTILADDAGPCLAAKSVEELHWLDCLDDSLFDSAHANVGLKQNLDKAVRTLKLVGPGAYSIQRQINL